MGSQPGMSRRNFLMSTGGAAVWAGSTRGYSAAEELLKFIAVGREEERG